MQATEALCHLSVTDIKKTFCNIWFFCKNEACANCTGWNATTVIWLLLVKHSLDFVYAAVIFVANMTHVFFLAYSHQWLGLINLPNIHLSYLILDRWSLTEAPSYSKFFICGIYAIYRMSKILHYLRYEYATLFTDKLKFRSLEFKVTWTS